MQPSHEPSLQDGTGGTADWAEDPTGRARMATGTALFGQQLTTTDLWGASGSASNATPDHSTRVETSYKAPPVQPANPVVSGQRHVSWEEMRARLQQEATLRRVNRRRSSSTKPDTPAIESGGLWAMSPTPSSIEGSREPPEPTITSPTASQADSDAPDAPTEGDVGQLSLFG